MDNLQVERRLERALEGNYTIKKLGDEDSVFGRYAVHSPSGKTYEIKIRHLGEHANSCTCPDFRTNLIGTCKHIEAVLVRVSRPARLRDSLPPVPDFTQIYLEYGEDLRIRLIRSPQTIQPLSELTDEYFDLNGYFKGDVARDLGSFLSAAKALGRIDVSNDVEDHVKKLRELALWRAERHRYLDRLDCGERLSVTTAPLYPYQERGAIHLATNCAAVLADEAGLGKSIQAIAGIEILRRDRGIQRAVIISPSTLRLQWSRLIRKFCGEEAVVVNGTQAERQAQYARRAAYTITDYEHAPKDVAALTRLAPEVAVLDEAERIRNWRSKTAEAVKQIDASFRWILTGSTLEDRLDDLYSVMQFVDQRLLGPLWLFNRRYYIFDGRKNIGHKNLDELRRRLSRVMLRRLYKEVTSQTPSLVQKEYFIPLCKEQRHVHDATLNELTPLLSGRRTTARRQRIRKHLKTLGAACVAPQLFDRSILTPSPKLEELVSIIVPWLHRGRRVVVFTAWARAARLVSDFVTKADIPHGVIVEETSAAQKRALVETYNSSEGHSLLIVTDRGSAGLNLKESDVAVNLEVPFRGTVWTQRLQRVHATRARGMTYVLSLLAEDSLEERIYDISGYGTELPEWSCEAIGKEEGPLIPDLGAAEDWERLIDLIDPPGSGTRPRPHRRYPGKSAATNRDSLTQYQRTLLMARSKVSAAKCLLEGGIPEEAVVCANDALKLMLTEFIGDVADDELLTALYSGPVRQHAISISLAAGISRARDLTALVADGAGDLVDLPVARAVVSDAEELLRLLEDRSS